MNHRHTGHTDLFKSGDTTPWSSILLTLPTSTLTCRSFPLGFASVDERSGGDTLPAGSQTLVVGPHGSGRTAVAARAAASATRALTGTRRKVVFATVEEDPHAVMDRLLREGLTLNQLKQHVRVAQVRTVADVAYLVAAVIADAVRTAAAADAPLDDYIPDLLVVDDAGALIADDAGRNATAVKDALAKLCSSLGDGTFFAEARAVAGTDQDRIRALTGHYSSGADHTGHAISTLVTRRILPKWSTASLGDLPGSMRDYHVADLVLATQAPAATDRSAQLYPEPVLTVLKSRHF